VAQLESGAAPATAPAAPAAALRGEVVVAPELAARIGPGDTLFIFARASDGSRMPLAIVRQPAQAGPVAFTLDDSQSMSPELKLSKFPEVVVGARVSRDGEARPKSGDLQGLSKPLPTGSTGVVVTINGTVP
jgi:cytochrome c-type biogenesis protein CcmH